MGDYMRLLLLFTFFLGFSAALPQGNSMPPDYKQAILQEREEQAKGLADPEGWLSLVALQPLTTGDVSVGSAAGNTLKLQHGTPHAFTLHVVAGKVILVAADSSVLLNGTHPASGTLLNTTEGKDSTLIWGDQYAYAIQRTENQTYLRVGDHHAPDLIHFHGLNFYAVNPAYRITARWVPYTPPHSLHMPTVLGTTLTMPSPGYAEFVVSAQTIRLDAIGNEKNLTISFRDGTSKTTTYGAGRHVEVDQPSAGLKSAGTVVIDFNKATNWPCAYTPYGTCPLPPLQNRFSALIPPGEKRFHD
jgi:uncharacterized protein (DUF1684 family)